MKYLAKELFESTHLLARLEQIQLVQYQEQLLFSDIRSW